MNIFSKFKAKTEVEGTWNHVFTGKHDTTLDFGQFGVMKAKFLTAGHGELRPWFYSNMEPMPQPTWGEVTYEYKAFVVPIPLIYKGYHDHKEDLIHVTANDSWTSLGYLPYATNGEIVKAIKNNMIPGTMTDYDIAIYVAGTQTYFKHTDLSFRMLKTLESLGIKLSWNDSYAKPYNILRLLAVAKIYMDYYYNKAYEGDLQSNTIKSYFERDNGNLVYSANDINNILVACKTVFYDPDFFISAWENPNTPNLSQQKTNYRLRDDQTGDIETQDNRQYIINDENNLHSGNGDPILMEGTENRFNPIVGISQHGLDLLRGLTMFLKRNQLAGGSIAERLLARYGSIPTAVKMKKARPIAEMKWKMNVDPIFSTADTAQQGGENLASYGGYGWAVSGKKGDAKFKFECEEDSIFIEILTIKPNEQYCQGNDGENFAWSRLDLPIPAFDALGTELITQDELLRGNSGDEPANVDTLMGSTGFAYTPRGSRFKIMRDTISGNFTLRKYREEYLPYTLQRFLDPQNFNHTNLVHSKEFTAITDGHQYDRIFYSRGKGEIFDNFRIHHELEIEWYTWMKPLYQVYDWEHEGGKEVTLTND